MERLGIFFFGLFSLAILAESTSVGSSTTTEASTRSNGCDAGNVIEKPHADLPKSKDVKSDPECSLVKQSHVKAVSLKDAELTKREDPSSHNAPLDSRDLIPPRLTRQVEESDEDESSNPSSEENLSVESDIESENIGSSQEIADPEGDLGVAEDRYQYPYWYRRQFANQRNRADRREPYRNYLRYPVFPGK